jgi:YidC/Oxa1 family membrane protein insertase
MSALFEGLADVLAWLYSLTRSYGFSIILLTLAVRILVTPLTIKGTRSMMAMQKFQPEIKRLQQEFKGDRQRLNEELMRFYRENQINPMGSCLPLLIQMPVFIILYRVVHGITTFGPDGFFKPHYLNSDSELYKSLSHSKEMLFLGLDLAKSAAGVLRDGSVLKALPYLVIIAIVTATSYIQQKQVSGRMPNADINPMQKNLMRIMPLSFAVFSFSFPAALGLYFVTSNLYQVGQQWYISRALYGMRKGQTSAEAPGVVETTAKPVAQPGEKNGPARRSPKPAPRTNKPNNPAGTVPPKARPTSGRVTEPKRSSPSRTKPRQEGAPGAPRKSTSRGQSGSRRVPFEQRDAVDGQPPVDPDKKRRR